MAELPSKPNQTKTKPTRFRRVLRVNLDSVLAFPHRNLNTTAPFFCSYGENKKKLKSKRRLISPLRTTVHLPSGGGLQKKKTIDNKRRFVENLAWLKVVSDVGCFFFYFHVHLYCLQQKEMLEFTFATGGDTQVPQLSQIKKPSNTATVHLHSRFQERTSGTNVSTAVVTVLATIVLQTPRQEFIRQRKLYQTLVGFCSFLTFRSVHF